MNEWMNCDRLETGASYIYLLQLPTMTLLPSSMPTPIGISAKAWPFYYKNHFYLKMEIVQLKWSGKGMMKQVSIYICKVIGSTFGKIEKGCNWKEGIRERERERETDKTGRLRCIFLFFLHLYFCSC